MTLYFQMLLAFSGLMLWPLFLFDEWFAHVVAGIVVGLCIALIWFLGDVARTVEYWSNSGPRWMCFLADNLWMRFMAKIPRTERNFIEFSKVHKYDVGKFGKIESIVGGLLWAAVLIYLGIGGYIFSYTALLYPTVWILGVCLSEMYFRRMYSRGKFTRINKD